jgi:anti-anti-sigma regulatory factor
MEHKLFVLVRLDIDRSSAVLAVNGCLTLESYRALLPIVRRASALIDGLNVIVDLRNAIHVDDAAAVALAESINDECRRHDIGLVTVKYPDVFPACALMARVPPLRRPAV